MADADLKIQGAARIAGGRGIASRRGAKLDREANSGRFVAVEAARKAGLLDGDASEHLSFRVPKALVDAARQETGVDSPTALGILALATVAQPDPVVAYMKRHRGRLGEAAELDY